MISRIGIETRLQLALTICVVTLVIVTTLGGSGGAPWVYFTYRTVLVAIAILCAIGTRDTDFGIDRLFLSCTALLFVVMLVSVFTIRGSHFEGFYLWFKYAFFACAFIGLANYARYQPARWKGLLLATVVAVNLAHLLPDLLFGHGQVVGFSYNNANYFGTFLLISLAGTLATAVFCHEPIWRLTGALSGALILFGILKTGSRGATIAAMATLAVTAIRARGRIPRKVWLAAGLAGLLAAVLFSPSLIRKFTDRGQIDPYNYARTKVWLGSLNVIAQSPILGVGFGQYVHISKRFTLPVMGAVAQYMKRPQMAHNEYLQHVAELGIPAALLLFSLLGYLAYLVWKRAKTAWDEFRVFHEAALLTLAGVGIHALVDNCWTIPVTASSLVVLSLADPLPLVKKPLRHRWKKPQLALAGVLAAVIYIYSTLIPGLGLYYNDRGHQAYNRGDLAASERWHLAAVHTVPHHPLFLDNLGIVYLDQAVEKKEPRALRAAREYFARAINAMPQSLEPYIHMETALLSSLSIEPASNLRIYEEIVHNDMQLLTIDPFIPFVRKNLANAYYVLGQPEHGMKELEKAIEYEPNFVPGYLQMAGWYEERGDAATSLKYKAAALGIVTKYQNFKPVEEYERTLLGRPTRASTGLSGQNH